ncbi:hypothetical protein [Celeribacter arenosi]|uniref:Uncharacterized protein n=1 Tax=Celeribacter arenosi TaxID=792649 RepID=A0ABP7K0Y8_9RHOB
MKGIGFAFFALGVLCALIGMAWGIQMSATANHALSPAHAHLNLIGWVTMALMGAYYTLTPAAASTRLAKIHLALTTAGVIIIVPGIVMALTQQGETAAKIGSVLTIAGMICFGVNVLRHGLGAKTAP